MVLHAKSNIYVLYSVSLPTIIVISFLLRYITNNRFAFLSLSIHSINVNIDMLQWDIVRSITFFFHLFFFIVLLLVSFRYLCIFPGDFFLREHRDYLITGSSNYYFKLIFICMAGIDSVFLRLI